MQFSTKAKTLAQLYGGLKTAIVLPQLCFRVGDWKQNTDFLLRQLKQYKWLENQGVIVRSSAKNEDAFHQSMAGHFDSVLDIRSPDALIQAVDQVIHSFIASGNDFMEDEIFIQPMLSDIEMSGVVFSREQNTNSPYFVINYDNTSGRTDSITAGNTNYAQVFYALKSQKTQIPKTLAPLLALVNELEILFEHHQLDIEFAISKGQIYLLQVRPLICNVPLPETDSSIFQAVTDIYHKIKDFNKKHPYLLGDRTIFGVMPDWNPAEIIGIRPRPLALSLYKEIVTDNIWAYQRNNYGYRNLRSFPLLIDFHGMPFIDVRVDFNSFIPQDLAEPIAEKLVNYYIDQLATHPEWHDKIEFEIVHTCYDFHLPEKLKKLTQAGFHENEIKQIEHALRNLTKNIIHGSNGYWRADIEKIHELETRYQVLMTSDLDAVAKIYWLIEDCKRYGTLPFAGLARAAFIATSLLKSMVEIGLLTSEEYLCFMNGVETINGQMAHDFHHLQKDHFLKKYGHLRPGTYDILSPRYDMASDHYFQWESLASEPVSEIKKQPAFSLSLAQLRKLKDLLKVHHLEYDVIDLFEFIKTAIESREYAKFVFTRNLSSVLSLFSQFGQKFDLTEENCSFADIQIIKKLYYSSSDPQSILAESIAFGKKAYQLTERIHLPPLICQPEDVFAFTLPRFLPNFVTLRRVTGQIIFKESPLSEFEGNILFIPQADPGYDWIFSHHIGGFVTMYGGMNSHMAIRANELGIPAIIGAGEQLYQQWSHAKLIEIDCANKQVKILRS